VQGIDKVAHFLVFGLLATLLLRSPLSRGKAWLAILIVSLFGITDEWHQSFVPGRSCDVYDWISDTLGATLAVMLYRHWGLYRRVLEWTPKYRRQALPEASPS
jgi:VanZ family protein